MPLKSAKKLINRIGGKKSKSKAAAPAPEPAQRRPELRAESRPQIGGHRAKTNERESREPLIGNHRRGQPEEGPKGARGGLQIGAHREKQPRPVKGSVSKGERSGVTIGSHRGWAGGAPKSEQRGELAIGGHRKGSEGAKISEAKVNAPLKVAPKEAPSDMKAKNASDGVPTASEEKKIGDVPEMKGPRNARDVMPLGPGPERSEAPVKNLAPLETNNYTSLETNNYTSLETNNYTSLETNNYTSLETNNYGYNNEDDGLAGGLGNYQTADTLNEFGGTAYGVIGAENALSESAGYAMFSTTSSGEPEESSKGAALAPSKFDLLQRVKEAKVAKLRAKIAADKAAAAKAAAEKAAADKAKVKAEPEKPKAPLKPPSSDTSNYATTNYAMSNYTVTDDMSDEEIPMISSSSVEEQSSVSQVHTWDMSAHTAEIDMLSQLEDAAAKVFDVQERHAASANPETAQLHSALRAGRKNLYDLPEIVKNKKTNEVAAIREIERERMSSNERKSEGWALIGMRTHHREDDLGKTTSKFPWDVKYAMSEFVEIETEVADYIGAHMAFQREDMLCEIYGGKLVDVAGQHIDTTQAEVGGQAQGERLNKLHDRLAEARSKGLGEKVDKLEKKIHIARTTPAKDKNIAGKFIYVMNAAGQFFATKPEQFKVHHSTMLAGGAVACAGEIQVAGGVIKSISNMSGHYRPGPVFLWQAVKQLEMSGASMGFSVDVVGVSRKFKTAHEFLGAMNPAADPQLFNGAYAAEVLEGKGRAE